MLKTTEICKSRTAGNSQIYSRLNGVSTPLPNPLIEHGSINWHFQNWISHAHSNTPWVSPCNPPGSSAAGLRTGTRAPARDVAGSGRRRGLGGRSLWSGGRCVVIHGATAGGGCVGPRRVWFRWALDWSYWRPKQFLWKQRWISERYPCLSEVYEHQWHRGQRPRRRRSRGSAAFSTLAPGLPAASCCSSSAGWSGDGVGAGRLRTPWWSEWERTQVALLWAEPRGCGGSDSSCRGRAYVTPTSSPGSNALGRLPLPSQEAVPAFLSRISCGVDALPVSPSSLLQSLQQTHPRTLLPALGRWIPCHSYLELHPAPPPKSPRLSDVADGSYLWCLSFFSTIPKNRTNPRSERNKNIFGRDQALIWRLHCACVCVC